LRPNFDRDVHCLLGLPFDALGMKEAVLHVQEAARERRPCFLSTPNLNFVVAAQRDAAFRDSVLRSDLSVVDGMPLVWVARLLGLPLRERVAGATLFERLRQGAGSPMRLFFFGGADGVAARACERLNAERGMLTCVGHDAPGFGSVQDMSGEERIARINDSGADFVVVALGAHKGQAWIEHNRARLQAPVVSHLGAVLNFVAGHVKRAPPWLQRGGLEWVWRIKEEPALWRRYGADGIAFAALLLRRVVPCALQSLLRQPSRQALDNAVVRVEADPQLATLRMEGAWTAANAAPLRSAFAGVAALAQPLRLDLRCVTHLDSAVIALLALLWASRRQAGQPWALGELRPEVRRQIVLACADYLLGPGAQEQPQPS
jgi:N-acetylglucosaminyldiphosphoundecaprenol N-acetyl-beta-D-mannosaminyltransferase